MNASDMLMSDAAIIILAVNGVQCRKAYFCNVYLGPVYICMEVGDPR